MSASSLNRHISPAETVRLARQLLDLRAEMGELEMRHGKLRTAVKETEALLLREAAKPDAPASLRELRPVPL